MLQLRLESFDGPLDLLLHLIKVHEVDIFNIPIVLITNQYLSFLSQVDDLDFHEAGDYLLMASQLIEIKAKMLVPILQNREVVEEEEILEGDPRAKLVADLLQYQTIKELASRFEKKNEEYHNTFISGEPQRRQDELEWYAKEGQVKGNPLDLIISFERVLLRFQKVKKDHKVKVLKQRITIQDQMKKLIEELRQKGNLSFFEQLRACETRYEIIVLFMAMLELAKEKILYLVQETAFFDILICSAEKIKTADISYLFDKSHEF